MRYFIVICLFFASLMSAIVAGKGLARAEENITIGYLEVVVPQPPVLSNLEPIPENEGLAGVEVAMRDNATTGKFLQHFYHLETVRVTQDEDVLEAARSLLIKTPYVIINAPSKVLREIAALKEAQKALLFNVKARDDALRGEQCSHNILHTIPSRRMLSDALAQFSVKKRWTKWALIYGAHRRDQAYWTALKQSAKKFNIGIVAEKKWAFDADMRRNAAKEVPLFTQDMPDHHLLVIADEIRDFSRYIPYNTWIARPVAGSEGAVPSAWSASVEQHGAAQLQSRFKDHAKRAMRPIDYAAWAAVRVVGEAVTRGNSAAFEKVRDYVLSDVFQLGGFKGRPLTFRKWNGQMRQPIVLSHAHAVVALAPLEGFLHQYNELDTLGLDRPESQCSVFKE